MKNVMTVYRKESETKMLQPVSMRPEQIFQHFGIPAPTIRNYVRQGKVKGVSNGKTMMLVDVVDLQEKLRRVQEDKEQWNDVFCSPVSSWSVSTQPLSVLVAKGGY